MKYEEFLGQIIFIIGRNDFIFHFKFKGFIQVKRLYLRMTVQH